MALRTDTFDLGALGLGVGEARRLELNVAIEPFTLAGQSYPALPEIVPVLVDVSRTTGDGYVLRLRFRASLTGPCMRCLQPAEPVFVIDAREVSQPGAGDELQSPYLKAGVLDVHHWARDSLVLALPATVLCTPECRGLCAVCGVDLNTAGRDHQHEPEPDQRWAKLSEIRFE